MKASIAAIRSMRASEDTGKRLDAIDVKLDLILGYLKKEAKANQEKSPTGRNAKKAPEGAEQKE